MFPVFWLFFFVFVNTYIATNVYAKTGIEISLKLTIIIVKLCAYGTVMRISAAKQTCLTLWRSTTLKMELRWNTLWLISSINKKRYLVGTFRFVLCTPCWHDDALTSQIPQIKKVSRLVAPKQNYNILFIQQYLLFCTIFNFKEVHIKFGTQNRKTKTLFSKFVFKNNLNRTADRTSTMQMHSSIFGISLRQK